MFFIRSQKKNPQLVYKGFIYNKKVTQVNKNTLWRCIDSIKFRCNSSVTTKNGILLRARENHSHPMHSDKLYNKRLYDVEEELDEFIEIKTEDQKLCNFVDVVDTGSNFKLIVHSSDPINASALNLKQE